MSRAFFAALLVVLATLPVFYFYFSEMRRETAACVARGVAHFKDSGSYPTLSNAPDRGRAAVDVAQERCDQATTAFTDG